MEHAPGQGESSLPRRAQGLAWWAALGLSPQWLLGAWDWPVGGQGLRREASMHPCDHSLTGTCLFLTHAASLCTFVLVVP